MDQDQQEVLALWKGPSGIPVQAKAALWLCKGMHLQVHKVNARTPKEAPKEESCLICTATEVLYLDRPADCNCVLLKVIRVLLHHVDRTLDTYTILED